MSRCRGVEVPFEKTIQEKKWTHLLFIGAPRKRVARFGVFAQKMGALYGRHFYVEINRQVEKCGLWRDAIFPWDTGFDVHVTRTCTATSECKG